MSDRREISFSSMDDVLADIQQLAQGEHRTVGKESFARIVRHLAKTNEMLTGQTKPPKFPLMMRIMMPMMRSKILNTPAAPGFTLPSAEMQQFFWGEGEPELSQAISQFKQSSERYNSQGPLPTHPLFGKATREQIDNLTLTHAAMHLSHVHPAG